MLQLVTFAVLATIIAGGAAASVPGCGAFASTADNTAVDLAPPTGFVEICGQDEELCRVLTAGYPSSTNTLGYFVTSEEWARYKAAPVGFTRYLIAQLAGSMSPGDLPGLKDYIRSQQASVPDHTALPRILESQGRAPIGIFEDSEDAVAFGAITKLRTTPPAPAQDIILASTNVAFVTRERVLSLYATLDVTENGDIEAVKELTRAWLRCLRAANK